MSRRAISLNGVPFLLLATCTGAIPTSAQIIADITAVLNTMDQIAVLPQLTNATAAQIKADVNIASSILTTVTVDVPAVDAATSLQTIAAYALDVLSILPAILPPPFDIAASAMAVIIKAIVNYASTANPELEFGSTTLLFKLSGTMDIATARQILANINNH